MDGFYGFPKCLSAYLLKAFEQCCPVEPSDIKLKGSMQQRDTARIKRIGMLNLSSILRNFENCGKIHTAFVAWNPSIQIPGLIQANKGTLG